MMNFIKHLESFVSSKLEITKDIFKLSLLEAKLAAMNITPLLLNLTLLSVFLLTLWLTLMVFLGELVLMFTKEPLIAIGTVLIIHLILIVFLARDVKTRLQQMSFSRTRDCLREPSERNDSEPEKENTIVIDQRT
ncbi:MAG: hypothetical protein H0T84_05875 [Tatlockia sp.]|nr:hypothetical protein [Tatlockia sp.]